MSGADQAGSNSIQSTPVMNKNFLKSKTFWLQVITFAAALFPPVTAWLTANPVEAIGAITAVNTLVRFATSGKVSVFAMDENAKGSVTPVIIGLIAAGALMGGLPSCTTITAPDGTVTRTPHTESIAASFSFSQWLYGVFRIERERAATEESVEVTPSAK